MRALEEIIILFVMNAVIAVMLAVGIMYQVRTDNNNRGYVQAICDQSHNARDGNLEQRCGEAQDKTHTEYLCAERSPTSRCWVEVK
jgi:hypothetical protein